MAASKGVVVLGMHRSGTSAVAGMFVRAGFFAGREDDVFPADESNALGHHENLGVMRTDESILIELGGWILRPPAREAMLAAAPSVVPVLQAHVDRMLDESSGSPIVVKDPRMAIMLPLWGEIIDELLHPVLVLREPTEVVASLQRRDGTPLPFGLAIWELHMTLLLEYLHGRWVTVAPYPGVVADAELAQSIVAVAASRLDDGRRRFVRPEDAPGALDQRLYHNRVRAADAEALLTRQQERLWEWLYALAPGDQRLDVPPYLCERPASVDALVAAEEERLRTFDELAGKYEESSHFAAERDAERARASELEGRLHEMEASLAAASARITEVEASLADANGRVSEVEASLADANGRVSELKSSLSSANQRTAELEAAIGSAQWSEHLMRASLSWRITKPLRAARRVLARGDASPDGDR